MKFKIELDSRFVNLKVGTLETIRERVQALLMEVFELFDKPDVTVTIDEDDDYDGPSPFLES